MNCDYSSDIDYLMLNIMYKKNKTIMNSIQTVNLSVCLVVAACDHVQNVNTIAIFVLAIYQISGNVM